METQWFNWLRTINLSNGREMEGKWKENGRGNGMGEEEEEEEEVGGFMGFSILFLPVCLLAFPCCLALAQRGVIYWNPVLSPGG